MARISPKQAWHTMEYMGAKSHVPLNRAARKAYTKMTGQDILFPAVLKPYVKDKTENATEERKKSKKD